MFAFLYVETIFITSIALLFCIILYQSIFYRYFSCRTCYTVRVFVIYEAIILIAESIHSRIQRSDQLYVLLFACAYVVFGTVGCICDNTLYIFYSVFLCFFYQS